MADNFVPVKRPKPSDDEDDILRMQQEFYEQKLAPSAKVVSLRSQKPKEDQPVARKQSKFAQRRSEEAQKKRISTSQECGRLTNEGVEIPDESEKVKKETEKIDPINNLAGLPADIVIGNIVERKVNLDKFTPEILTKKDENLGAGFPTVFISSEVLQDDKSSNESLFMRALTKQRTNSVPSTSCKKKEMPIGDSSHIVSGTLADEIHKENVEKLKEMSQEEILAEKKNLEAMLDPSMLAFIKSMKNKSKVKSGNNTMEVDVEPSAKSKDSTIENLEIEKKVSFQESKGAKESIKMETDGEEASEELPEPVGEIVKEVEEKGWVHMDDLEPEKVKWMEDLPIDKGNKQPPEEPYNARFDFQGTLLPFNDENLTIDQGLHHHGEEPERPGYSLQELLQLARSAAQQQRCMALTTLTNILEKTHLGWYDKALQPPLLNVLNQKNILLLLRFALDDTALPVVTAALQALRAFLFCETDEICLDKIFGFEDFNEPVLRPSMSDVDDVESLKDHELAQLDSVAAAVRSDIVFRLRFILGEMQPPPSGMTAALEILSRLARHSHETALNIACTPNLLDVIVKKCIPLSMNRPSENPDPSKPFGCPLVAAVRLCRILIMYAGRPVVERLKNLQIIHSLLTYISSDASRQEVRLHIESLRLWRLFLNYGVETDSVIGSRLTLISQLRLLESTLDLDVASPLKCDYAAALVAIAKFDEPLKQHVDVLLAKWSTQLSRISMPSWNQTILIAETLKTLDNVSSFQTNWIKNSNVFIGLSSSSNLLSDFEPATDRDPSALPSLGVMTFEGKLQAVMSQHSHIIFLTTALEYFLRDSRIDKVEQLLENANVQNYLSRLRSNEWSLERSWFTRMEYSLLMTIIQAEDRLTGNLKNKMNDTIWRIAIKLIPALPADCPLNVRDILVFSLAPERINVRLLGSSLENLKFADAEKENKEDKSLNNPSLAAKLYEKFVNPKGKWSEAAMPKDWMYLPLIDSYTRMRNKNIWRDSSTLNVLYMLKLEFVMPELTQNLSPTLRFSRMVLLYLCDTAFVLPPVCELPQKIIAQLVGSHYQRLDLSGEVPGLNSFTDLFTALCESYIANSYGQDCFAQALLVFIAQRFDVHYRKLLWSEHAGVIQYCRLTSDKLLMPIEEYLYPVEKDTSLIEAYITALVRGSVRENQSPFLYSMALHHSAMFLKEQEKIATVMRTRVGRLLADERKRSVAERLLNYEPIVKKP